MINRRLLRIKILQALYAFKKSPEQNVGAAEKELFHSIEKSHELYFMFLLLLVEIKNYAARKIDTIKSRIHKDSDQWLNIEPLANNKLIEKLENDETFSSVVLNDKISWHDGGKIISQYYESIIDSDLYKNYIKVDKTFNNDKKFTVSFIENLIGENEDIFTYLEDRSVYWNDEADFVASMALKTIKKIKESTPELSLFLEVFRDDEDKDFTKKLFRSTISNMSDFDELIKIRLKNWELERIAEIDLLILKLALNEAIEFPAIPLKVTINEYIDITKYYSTEKSSIFINGILDRIIKELKADGTIKKTGKGLIE